MLKLEKSLQVRLRDQIFHASCPITVFNFLKNVKNFCNSKLNFRGSEYKVYTLPHIEVVEFCPYLQDAACISEMVKS